MFNSASNQVFTFHTAPRGPIIRRSRLPSHPVRDIRSRIEGGSLRDVDSGIWDRFAGWKIFHRGSAFKKNEARRAAPSLPLPHLKTEQTRPRCPTVHFFFLPTPSPPAFLPSSFLPARTRRHAAATWQRLFAGGWKKKSASLFCCLSQQLSQGPCLRGRRGRLSLIFFLSLLLALPSLSLSLFLCMHLQ